MFLCFMRLIIQQSHQHSELCTPVADVVLADDFVAEEFVYPADAVANNGAPQMAYVHLLGNVRAGKIDNNSLRYSGLIYAEIIRAFVDFK
ncbi:hypothetical protein ES703_26410 [subsurface metagenome]